MLKKIGVIGYSAALATSPVLLSACQAPAADAETPTVLFSLTSDSMRFENPDGMDVTLVMENVDPHAIWFTDRPDRESGAITTQMLADEWGDDGTFRADPPNAALVLHEPLNVNGETTDTLVVEVNDADYDASAQTFRADLTIMEDEDLENVEGNLSAHAGRHDAAWPTEAGAVSLFIDSITLCSTPSTCSKNATNNYTVNSTIYFQTTIQDNVTSAPVMTQTSSLLH